MPALLKLEHAAWCLEREDGRYATEANSRTVGRCCIHETCSSEVVEHSQEKDSNFWKDRENRPKRHSAGL